MKRAIEAALVRAGVASAGRRLRGSGRLILAYHNIVPSEVHRLGDTSLHLARDAFARQLDQLRRTHDVLPLDQVVDARDSASRRPRAAITFDDAYRGAVTLGVHELVERELPATIFVAPALLGQPSFWWDALVSASGSGLADDVRREALTTRRGADSEVRAWAREAGRAVRAPGPEVAPASEQELTAAAEQPGITVASHSWSHPNLTRLGATELETELGRPLVWLRERFSSSRPWLAYPYGLSSAEVERAAAGAGYEIAVRVEGGWFPRGGADRLSLPRLNVPAGVSAAGFELRTAGFFCR